MILYDRSYPVKFAGSALQSLGKLIARWDGMAICTIVVQCSASRLRGTGKLFYFKALHGL